MRMRYFGDSYDIVKRFLPHTIDPEGSWAAFPMFTDSDSQRIAAGYEAFLGVRVIRSDTIQVDTVRREHFEISPHEHRLFVDPNTGIRMGPPTKAKSSPDYVFSEELIRLCVAEPQRLVVVFDQSHPRGAERESLRRKLEAFQHQGLHGFAYSSHAGFVVLSAPEQVLTAARNRLTLSGLPGERIVVVQP